MSNLRQGAYQIDPALWVREVVGVVPMAWQDTFLRAPRGASILALTARQVGKTMTAAWAIAHAMQFYPNSLSVIACPAQRQSAEAVRRVREILVKVGAKLVSDNVYGLELDNGARVLALPGSDDSIRGLTVDAWIVANEAARLGEDIIAALRPMRARRPQALFLWQFGRVGNSLGWRQIANSSPQHVDPLLEVVGSFERFLDIGFVRPVLGVIDSVTIVIFRLRELLLPVIRHLPCRWQRGRTGGSFVFFRLFRVLGLFLFLVLSLLCFLGRSDRRLADLFGLLTIFDGQTADLLFFQVLAGRVGAALFFTARGGPPAGCTLTAPLSAHVLWTFRGRRKTE